MKRTICLWSGPRNVSTALMYSFAQRDDIRVVDEPLYAHYLRVSGADHPGRDAVLASAGALSHGNTVLQNLLDTQQHIGNKRLFVKQMAHHLVGIDTAVLPEFCNVLLIRDPVEMLPSLTAQLPNAGLNDTGLKRQYELYVALCADGITPAILDARELLLDPRNVLVQLCDYLQLKFSDAMLCWPAGPRPEDGVWARHWYQNVHRSKGFAPYRAKARFPSQLDPLLSECQPWYEKLYAHAIKASP